MSKRRLDIDILRIVGALFVVMYHYGSLSGWVGNGRARISVLSFLAVFPFSFSYQASFRLAGI